MVRREKEVNQNEQHGTEPFESVRGVTNRVHAMRVTRNVLRVLLRAEGTKRWSN
jgi:hypothetical protein